MLKKIKKYFGYIIAFIFGSLTMYCLKRGRNEGDALSEVREHLSGIGDSADTIRQRADDNSTRIDNIESGVERVETGINNIEEQQLSDNQRVNKLKDIISQGRETLARLRKTDSKNKD